MDGLYFLTYIIAIFFVIQWYTTNEAAKTDDGSKGLLKMKPTADKEKSGNGRGRKKPARYAPSMEDWTHRPHE